MKQVILMGVNDQELVQKLLDIIPVKSLDQVMQLCYDYEASRKTATVIVSPTMNVCATSQYRREKKAKHQQPRPPSPPTSPCRSCNGSHGNGRCPAADKTCRNCGKKGHHAKTPRCPATNVTCHTCGRKGHFSQQCRSSKTSNDSSATSTKHPHRGSKASSARRVSTTRTPHETSPPVIVTVTHDKGIGKLSMLPDTGADTSIIGPDHLSSVGLTPEDLLPPPQTPTFTADGSTMQPAIGSVQVQLQVKDGSTREWIDVHPNTPVPLLSYRACRELSLIPDKFPQPIAQVTHARAQRGRGKAECQSTNATTSLGEASEEEAARTTPSPPPGPPSPRSATRNNTTRPTPSTATDSSASFTTVHAQYYALSSKGVFFEGVC